jgi:hypothetical protein
MRTTPSSLLMTPSSLRRIHAAASWWRYLTPCPGYRRPSLYPHWQPRRHSAIHHGAHSLPYRPPPRGRRSVLVGAFCTPRGGLVIDGKPGPSVSASATDSLAVHHSRGRHTVEYTAAYLPILRCIVSVPTDQNDACPFDRSWDGAFATSGARLTRVLDLQATRDRLPPPVGQASPAATQAQLSAAASALPPGGLRAGDHCLDAQGAIQQITSSSVARTLEPQFDLSSKFDYYMGAACVTERTRTGLGEDYSSQGWARNARCGSQRAGGSAAQSANSRRRHLAAG